MQVIYVETMSWLLQFYLHTLEVIVNGIKTGPSMLFYLLSVFNLPPQEKVWDHHEHNNVNKSVFTVLH